MIDEAYHIAAGIFLRRYHDFRLNPEQPPLVTLWVGSFMAAAGFHLDSLRQFGDKVGERIPNRTRGLSPERPRLRDKCCGFESQSQQVGQTFACQCSQIP